MYFHYNVTKIAECTIGSEQNVSKTLIWQHYDRVCSTARQQLVYLGQWLRHHSLRM